MKTHSEIGAETIRQVRKRASGFPMLKMAEEIAASHHEWYNGAGYPRGLKGDAIPLSARIVAVADAYDSLTSKHVYRDPVGHREAVTTILRSSGTQFDPTVVEAFLLGENEFGRVAKELADAPEIETDGSVPEAKLHTAEPVTANQPD